MTVTERKLPGEARSADEVMEDYRRYRSRLNRNDERPTSCVSHPRRRHQIVARLAVPADERSRLQRGRR